MKDPKIIEFIDPYSNDRNLIIVRTYIDKLVLGIAIEKNGDLETAFDLRIGKELVEVLQNAIRDIENKE